MITISTEYAAELTAAFTAAGMEAKITINEDIPHIWVTDDEGPELLINESGIYVFTFVEDLAPSMTWPLLPVPEIVLRVQLLLSDPGRVCPKCGSGDIQLDGLQAIRVVEDWTDGERWNYEYPEKPSGQWITLEAHCNACDHEWAPALPQGEDLTHAGELLPCAGEEKPTAGVYRCLQIC